MSAGQRQRRLMLLTTVCLGILVGDRLLLQPVIKHWQAEQAEATRLELELERARAMSEQADRWLERAADYRSRALPKEPSDAENIVIHSLRGWAGSTGLDILSMRQRWRNGKNVPPILEVRLNGTGTLKQLARFLYESETSPLPLRVAGTSAARSGTSPRLTITVEVEARLPLPEEEDDDTKRRSS